MFPNCWHRETDCSEFFLQLCFRQGFKIEMVVVYVPRAAQRSPDHSLEFRIDSGRNHIGHEKGRVRADWNPASLFILGFSYPAVQAIAI